MRKFPFNRVVVDMPSLAGAYAVNKKPQSPEKPKEMSWQRQGVEVEKGRGGK